MLPAGAATVLAPTVLATLATSKGLSQEPRTSRHFLEAKELVGAPMQAPLPDFSAILPVSVSHAHSFAALLCDDVVVLTIACLSKLEELAVSTHVAVLKDPGTTASVAAWNAEDLLAVHRHDLEMLTGAHELEMLVCFSRVRPLGDSGIVIHGCARNDQSLATAL